MLVAEVTSVAEMRARYAQARERLERGSNPAPKPARRQDQVAVLRSRMIAMEDDLRRLRSQVARHLKIEGEAKAVVDWPARKHWKLIIAEVADAHDVLIADLLSPRRAVRLVHARHEAMWRLRNETTMSLPMIGKRLGGRDHTTVLHGIRKHEERLGAK